ncbi:leucyl aminopeptidase [Sphingomonas lacunae]|uniref:Probable cytosol aminopeptidase n=1 Tax=Sphingomonas lacunae TaxID=2698828 RepID=A0A6M4AQ04_9SPHN|nr:M17 family metallopeptidase [Sphingomonas lacunae]QJQ31154.1 leucyl aminopeptidase [Sphingomonas lacunae]
MIRHRLCSHLAIALASSALVVTAAPVAAQQVNRTVAHDQVQRDLGFVASVPSAPAGTLVLPLADAAGIATAPGLADADRAAVTRAVSAARFTFPANGRLSLRGIGAWEQILLVGRSAEPTAADAQQLGIVIARALQSENGPITLAVPGMAADLVGEMAIGFGLGQYRSDLFQTRNRSESGAGPISIVADDPAAANGLWQARGQALVRAMAWTRTISNEPANAVYPESFVARARAAFEGLPGVSIEVLDVPAMERLGMGAILGVGRGSERPPRMMIVRYRGQGAPEGGPLVLAGKGITFDTGGISIKPSSGMGNMRMDMSGAASVVGAVLSLAGSRAPVDVIAIAALAENMPDGRSIRPGDVLTAYNGMTIEIDSTDAEGRLVLADAVSYADATMRPSAIVDVATLTGAIRTALGDDFAGLFSRQDALADQLLAAGMAVGEPLWRLPLHASYAGDTSSNYADIRNGGGDGSPGAGAGAHFIGEFIRRETPWAHLDIANVAWAGASDTRPGGSTAYSVRLLDRFVRDWRPAERPAP